LLLTCTLSLYEPNATRMRLNGAKTLDLWTRQGWKDLIAINYRSGGLADEFCKTLSIVLAKGVEYRG
jgi:hypothetical protein